MSSDEVGAARVASGAPTAGEEHGMGDVQAHPTAPDRTDRPLTALTDLAGARRAEAEAVVRRILRPQDHADRRVSVAAFNSSI
jgi:FXSXX-COOH protein